MIINKDGEYFLRDLGRVHTSKVRLDDKSEYQLQLDTIIDFGKVVHYHVDRLTHRVLPSMKHGEKFQGMRPNDLGFEVGIA